MVAAALVVLVGVDTFLTGLLIGKVRRLQAVAANQADQLKRLVEVSAEHDFDLAHINRVMNGGKDE